MSRRDNSSLIRPNTYRTLSNSANEVEVVGEGEEEVEEVGSEESETNDVSVSEEGGWRRVDLPTTTHVDGSGDDSSSSDIELLPLPVRDDSGHAGRLPPHKGDRKKEKSTKEGGWKKYKDRGGRREGGMGKGARRAEKGRSDCLVPTLSTATMLKLILLSIAAVMVAVVVLGMQSISATRAGGGSITTAASTAPAMLFVSSSPLSSLSCVAGGNGAGEPRSSLVQSIVGSVTPSEWRVQGSTLVDSMKVRGVTDKEEVGSILLTSTGIDEVRMEVVGQPKLSTNVVKVDKREQLITTFGPGPSYSAQVDVASKLYPSALVLSLPLPYLNNASAETAVRALARAATCPAYSTLRTSSPQLTLNRVAAGPIGTATAEKDGARISAVLVASGEIDSVLRMGGVDIAAVIGAGADSTVDPADVQSYLHVHVQAELSGGGLGEVCSTALMQVVAAGLAPSTSTQTGSTIVCTSAAAASLPSLTHDEVVAGVTSVLQAALLDLLLGACDGSSPPSNCFTSERARLMFRLA
uniref:Uncharacterized protein n=1 Tax=Palpitomonas bilix TaxID=652834 RepID=A0A7S3D455_9EUKA|mmetsp:Transcript_20331/g.52058  ORF Transcript_20331/g.52058 Transcript_20331/m.52058 type:complete len:524 (+) Transcript_20331:208-1779(+)